MIHAFTNIVDFLLLLLLLLLLHPSPANTSLEAQIPVFEAPILVPRPKSQSLGPNPSLKDRWTKEKEEEEEKIPHMRESIGH